MHATVKDRQVSSEQNRQVPAGAVFCLHTSTFYVHSLCSLSCEYPPTQEAVNIRARERFWRDPIIEEDRSIYVVSVRVPLDVRRRPKRVFLPRWLRSRRETQSGVGDPTGEWDAYLWSSDRVRGNARSLVMSDTAVMQQYGIPSWWNPLRWTSRSSLVSERSIQGRQSFINFHSVESRPDAGKVSADACGWCCKIGVQSTHQELVTHTHTKDPRRD